MNPETPWTIAGFLGLELRRNEDGELTLILPTSQQGLTFSLSFAPEKVPSRLSDQAISVWLESYTSGSRTRFPICGLTKCDRIEYDRFARRVNLFGGDWMIILRRHTPPLILI